MSKSDPQVDVFVTQENSPDSEWTLLGQTETIKDNLKPKFKKWIGMFYSESCLLKFVVYDVDDEDSEEEERELIGEATYSLKLLLESQERKVSLPLECSERKKNGTIHIKCVAITGVIL